MAKKIVKPKLSDETKEQIKAKCDAFVDKHFPDYIRPEPDHPRFSYIIGLHTKWHRNYFYFCATYRCPSENCISEFFETKYTRLEYLATDKYNLSYMRHTGKWYVVYYDLSLDECLTTIEDEELFHPV